MSKVKIKSMNQKKDDLLRLLLENKSTGKEISWNDDYDELSKYLFSDGYVFEKDSKQEMPVINLEGEDFLRKGGYKGKQRRKAIKWISAVFGSVILAYLLSLLTCR